MRPETRWIWAALMLCASGCMHASLSWEFELENSVVGVVTIGAYVSPGTCAEMNEAAGYFFAYGESSPVTPEPLDSGSYCFEVVAYDADCRVLAQGAQEVELPSEQEFVLISVRPVPLADEIDAVCAAYVASTGS